MKKKMTRTRTMKKTIQIQKMIQIDYGVSVNDHIIIDL
jgi:hypothetical protein